MPELERWVLHELTEVDKRIRTAVETYDWTGVYPELHTFCAGDLSAFYFDIRKDVLYCDRPDSLRRRAARTVLDHLHLCLTTWLAPVLCFTADEAWCARFGEQDSVHLHTFPILPDGWSDPQLASKWEKIRSIRRRFTIALELSRASKALGSSLQASVSLPLSADDSELLSSEEWAEVGVVSRIVIVLDPNADHPTGRQNPVISLAPGTKCARCWRVLEEVGTQPKHPALCLRCTDAVESGLVCRAA
jgi:isoleucyl-tRNA synthetase